MVLILFLYIKKRRGGKNSLGILKALLLYYFWKEARTNKWGTMLNLEVQAPCPNYFFIKRYADPSKFAILSP